VAKPAVMRAGAEGELILIFYFRNKINITTFAPGITLIITVQTFCRSL